MGERKAAVLWRGGDPFLRERKWRKGWGVRKMVSGFHKKKPSLATDWRVSGTEWCRLFAVSGAQALKFWKCTTFSNVKL